MNGSKNTLKDFDGLEIDFYNNDEACVSFRPQECERFFLQYEEAKGAFDFNDLFWIIVIKDGREISRHNALKCATSIYWKEQ